MRAFWTDWLPTETPFLPQNDDPRFVGSVSASGLDKVLQDFLPQIVAEVNSLTVPAMSGKASGVDYSIDAIKLADFKIGSALRCQTYY